MPALTMPEQLSSEIIELEGMLLNEHPKLPYLLATIHRKLAEHPQLTQSLTDEEIGVIVSSLSAYTTEAIVTKPKKKKAPSLKNLSVDDLL